MSPSDFQIWVLYLKPFFAGSLNLVVVLLCAERTSFCTFPEEVESASITGACRAGATRRAELSYQSGKKHSGVCILIHLLLLKIGNGKYEKWVNTHRVSRWKNLWGDNFSWFVKCFLK